MQSANVSSEDAGIPFARRVRARIERIELGIGQPLLKSHEIEDGRYRVKDSIFSGFVASSRRVAAKFDFEILSPTFAFGDIVLERRDGAQLAILVPPDMDALLAQSRWLRIDPNRRPFILHHGLSPDFPSTSVSRSALQKRRQFIENKTRLHLSSLSSLPPGPLWGSFILSVDPGHVVVQNENQIEDRGRALGDVVIRLPDGKLFAILVDPEEAAAIIRVRPRRLMFDIHRRDLIL